jgi:acid phosphatase
VNARFIDSNVVFDAKIWAAWTAERRSKALPGAVEFLSHARRRGVSVFYITNRDVSEEAATRTNLRKQGLPLQSFGGEELSDNILSRGERPEWTSDKSSRRAAVARRFRVLLLLGDDLNDFLSGVRTDVGARLEKTLPYESWWGSKWFMLPNPMYGSWEDSLYNFDRAMPASRVTELKLERLRRE